MNNADSGPLASKQYQDESMEVVNLFLSGRRSEGLRGMLDMEKKYPGRGWREERHDLLNKLHLEDPETEEPLPF